MTRIDFWACPAAYKSAGRYVSQLAVARLHLSVHLPPAAALLHSAHAEVPLHKQAVMLQNNCHIRGLFLHMLALKAAAIRVS